METKRSCRFISISIYKQLSLFQRNINAFKWTTLANWLSILILISRSLLLTRWLPIDAFGIYTWVSTILSLTLIVADFGLGESLIHRAKESLDEQHAVNTHFTLKFLFVLIWALILSLCSAIFATGQVQTAFFVLIAARAMTTLGDTPKTLLIRRVIHRRLALLQFSIALATTVIAVYFAYEGYGLWSLLVTDIITAVITIVLLYLWRPVWRPKLVWQKDRINYFLSFGQKSFLATILVNLLDRIDDLWVGAFLGDTSLGLYSRAYTFATYPRRILASPINKIMRGTYAELKGERKRLSTAFTHTNSLLIRTGFLLAGVLILAAPLLIGYFGDRWLAMLPVFRLMILFVLIDPIKGNLGTLLIAVGQPQVVTQIRLIQLTILIIGLFSLGYVWGITGVALAANLMLIVGICLFFKAARPYIDFSLRQIFANPLIGLGLAFIAVLFFRQFNLTEWGNCFLLDIFIEVCLFCFVYLSWLSIREWQNLTSLWQQIAR